MRILRRAVGDCLIVGGAAGCLGALVVAVAVSPELVPRRVAVGQFWSFGLVVAGVLIRSSDG